MDPTLTDLLAISVTMYRIIRRHEEEITNSALFVAMSYPDEKPVHELPYSMNNITIMLRLLTELYNLQEENVTVLTDMNRRISSALVKRILRERIASLMRGDSLMFYFAGYGSRQRSNYLNNTHYVESFWLGGSEYICGNLISGFNLIVLCYIIICVMNLMCNSDVELRNITTQVVRGAKFTVVVNCCHSGGIIEGAIEQVGSSIE